MESCTSCGHELGVGRFCTNCGHPVGAPLPDDLPTDGPPDDDWRTRTAERPAVVPPLRAGGPVSPPLVPEPGRGHGPRYPLYADEVTAAPAVLPAGLPHHRGQRRWLPWVAGFAVLVLIGALGLWLLTGDGQPDGTDRAVDPTRSDSSSPAPTPTTSVSPSTGKAEDVAQLATATVPATAPPNQDVSGNMVRYEARNMLDGVPETCWRMPGDASGEEITVQLADPTTLTKVGLVNGYAKTATDASGRRLDWYHGNRRILSVEWTFDDGTIISQSLDDTRKMQTIEVDSVTTSTVRLRLVSVSSPGSGPAARNYTAISDVSLVGIAR